MLLIPAHVLGASQLSCVFQSSSNGPCGPLPHLLSPSTLNLLGWDIKALIPSGPASMTDWQDDILYTGLSPFYGRTLKYTFYSRLSFSGK